jgi:type I restriction enzyme, S subunit
LNSALNAEATKNQVDATVHGVGRPRRNLSEIKAIAVPVPPLAEQHEIVRRVTALLAFADSIEQRLIAASSRANALTQSILAKAFRGELVPTEAALARAEGRDYEPASVLLDRIAQTRQSSRPNTRSPRNGATRAAALK